MIRSATRYRPGAGEGNRRDYRVYCLAVILLVLGCSEPAPAAQTLTLATTTSAQDSGVLDILVPIFEVYANTEVKVVAGDIRQALQLARRGDADVLLVDDPAAEKKFMEDGFGALRRVVLYNDFVLVGPTIDPARVEGETSITHAFAKIARHCSPFISRGDESSTHERERPIWRAAKIEPQGDWYIQARADMGQVLRLADEKWAYTLSDRATFLAQREGTSLAVLCQGDPLLVNSYSVIVVNPEKHPLVRYQAARVFAEFLLTPEVQKTIAHFGVDRYGQPLFSVAAP